MNRKFIFAGLAAGAIAVSGFAAGTTGASAMPSHDKIGTNAVRVCAKATKVGQMACDALAVADSNGRIIQSAKSDAAKLTKSNAYV